MISLWFLNKPVDLFSKMVNLLLERDASAHRVPPPGYGLDSYMYFAPSSESRAGPMQSLAQWRL